MIVVPREPVPGAGVSASWGRDVVRCLRAGRVIAGPGISVTDGPNGQQVSARRRMARESMSVPSPWDMRIEGEQGVLSNCVFMHSGVTTVIDDQAVALSGTECYIAAKIDTTDFSATVTAGASIDSAVHTGEISDAERFYLVLLYKCVKNLSGVWAIAVDYRRQIFTAIYG